MKRLLVLGLTLLMASNVMAQVDPDPNGIGIFFDSNYTSRCGTMLPSAMTPVYLVASNITQTGLAGWEVEIVPTYSAPGMGMMLNAALGGLGAINLYTAPEFQVGLGVPMEAQPNLLLATMNFMVFAPGVQISFAMKPITHFPSFPQDWVGDPPPFGVYADAVDVGILIPFQSAFGPQQTTVAWVNAVPCPATALVPVLDETWGGVKGMFK